MPWAERFFFCLRDARRALRTSSSRAAAVQTSNQIFNETLCRSVADLYMLVTDTAQGPYPYAGIPWFCTAFGRDGIITAMQCCGSTLRSPGACCGFSRRRRPRSSGPRPTPSPGRSCTRPGGARWRGSAKCPSDSTMAASTPRRCSSCWPGCTTSAPAISTPSARSGRTSRRRCAGSTSSAIATATASSSTRPGASAA